MTKKTKTIQIAVSFDYGILAPDQRFIVQQRTGQIREQLRRSAQDIWEIGQKLVEVRDCLKYGQFNTWLKAEFGWSRRTAYNFINVYETFQDSANLAQVDIATSVLYLLAAPSTPTEVREEVLNRAKAGDKVTSGELRQAIKEEKDSCQVLKEDILSLAETDSSAKSLRPTAPRSDIVKIIPKSAVAAEPLPIETQAIEVPFSKVLASPQSTVFESGWYSLENRHFLFCGDTASEQFAQQVPEATFALAITSYDWDHEWLIDGARTLTVLPESDVENKLIEQLLLMFSSPGDIVIFPWLPSQEMLVIADRLERQVYAGDPNPERCQRAMAYAGLAVEKINR
ncbi:MAG TPA: DUF3102 domain-containing protein [Elainellaceae cyanobacterium]